MPPAPWHCEVADKINGPNFVALSDTANTKYQDISIFRCNGGLPPKNGASQGVRRLVGKQLLKLPQSCSAGGAIVATQGVGGGARAGLPDFLTLLLRAERRTEALPWGGRGSPWSSKCPTSTRKGAGCGGQQQIEVALAECLLIFIECQRSSSRVHERRYER